MAKLQNLLLFLTTISFSYAVNVVQIIESHGYPCETHYITTEDGYILTAHRIPHGKDNNESITRHPVYILHGLGSSSADWVNSDTKSLGFILADLGYDVWLGNSRGNTWSRNHTTIDYETDRAAFYNFSWHEMGYYDLPASIDYVLKESNQEKLYYIGHSQGGTAFIIMGSEKPEYNDKIQLASLMAPSTFQTNPDLGLKLLCEVIYELEALANALHLYDLPYSEVIRAILPILCEETSPLINYCTDIIFILVGYADLPQLDLSTLPVTLSNIPANLGLRQLFHYGQVIKSKQFRQYDFGENENLVKYGTEEPPEYNVKNITSPVAVYYGKNDKLVNHVDAKLLADTLPNLAKDGLIDYELFNHLDFVYAKDVVTMLYDDVINLMKEY